MHLFKFGSMNKNNKTKAQKSTNFPSALETLKDITNSTVDQVKYEANQMAKDLIDQIFGISHKKSFSGEITPGEALEINEILADKREEITKNRKKLYLEKQIIENEKVTLERRTNELRIQLKSLQEEITVLTQKTQGLAQETQIAAMQTTVNPGVYHLTFFEKLLEFISSFRKKIEEAQVWLHAVNKRAAKKNAWGSGYKKYGAKYLLSGEHYLQRSAG